METRHVDGIGSWEGQTKPLLLGTPTFFFTRKVLRTQLLEIRIESIVGPEEFPRRISRRVTTHIGS